MVRLFEIRFGVPVTVSATHQGTTITDRNTLLTYNKTLRL